MQLLLASARLALHMYDGTAIRVEAFDLSFRLSNATGRHLVVDDSSRAPFDRLFECQSADVETRKQLSSAIGDEELHNELGSMAFDVFWVFGWNPAMPMLRDALADLDAELRQATRYRPL
jgi:hypothetical protein